MDCVKCGTEMVKGIINTRIDIQGKEEICPPFSPKLKSYSPVYVYVCEECGYMEFQTNKKNDRQE